MGNDLGYDFTNTSPDIPLREFWRQNEHFADLFNTCMFDGRMVVDPDTLTDMDGNESISIFNSEFQKTIKRVRDVLKMSETGACYRILGIENQQAIHYAMPLRCMVYDTLTYLHQADVISRNNRKEKQFDSPDEFLSSFKKDDRLYPCYTIVIYWGERKWDGPRCLADMMEFGEGEPFREQFGDYPMKLLCVNETDGLKPETDDVFKLFTVVRELYRSGGTDLPDVLSDVNVEVAYIASLVTGTTAQYGRAIAEARKNRKERLDMCDAVSKAFMKAKMEAMAEGKEEGKAEGELSLLYKLIKSGKLSVEEAADSIDQTADGLIRQLQSLGLKL